MTTGNDEPIINTQSAHSTLKQHSATFLKKHHHCQIMKEQMRPTIQCSTKIVKRMCKIL